MNDAFEQGSINSILKETILVKAALLVPVAAADILTASV